MLRSAAISGWSCTTREVWTSC